MVDENIDSTGDWIRRGTTLTESDDGGIDRGSGDEYGIMKAVTVYDKEERGLGWASFDAITTKKKHLTSGKTLSQHVLQHISIYAVLFSLGEELFFPCQITFNNPSSMLTFSDQNNIYSTFFSPNSILTFLHLI